MIWPWLMGFSALVVAVAWLAGDRWAVAAGATVLAAYGAMRLVPMVPDAYAYAVSAAIWITAAVAIPRQNTYKVSVVRALLALVALCYLWARVIAAPQVFGSLPFVLSDLLAILAMLHIGARGFAHILDRIRDMAGRGDRHQLGPRPDVVGMDQEEMS